MELHHEAMKQICVVYPIINFTSMQTINEWIGGKINEGCADSIDHCGD